MTRRCEACGSAFDAKPYKVRAGKARYCSRRCYLRTVTPPARPCVSCGGTIAQTGWSHEAKYCSQACYRTDQPAPAFRGGRRADADGYVLTWAPDSPMARSNGYAAEHRLVAAQVIGRALERAEVVHHVNGDKSDNRPENLMLFASQREHMAHHAANGTEGNDGSADH